LNGSDLSNWIWGQIRIDLGEIDLGRIKINLGGREAGTEGIASMVVVAVVVVVVV